MLSFTSIVHNVLGTMFRLGGEWIKDATFIRPTGLNAATGLSSSSQTEMACKILCLGFHPMELTLVKVQAGDEKILVRASELAGISSPGENDRIVENSSGLVRRILASRLDVTGEFWLFQTERTGDEDLGDLSTSTLFEDRGDLTATTLKEDWGTLF